MVDLIAEKKFLELSLVKVLGKAQQVLMMISLTQEVIPIQQIEHIMVDLIVEKKQKSFLELSLVEVLDKVQQVLVEVLMVVDIVVKMVVVAIKEILLIHILPIKVNTILS